MDRRMSIKMIAASALAPSGTVFADAAYPNKAIKLIVPFSAGGSTDATARLLGQKMSASLGRPVVVENMGGAAGAIASAAAARAAPDGYTLQIATSGTHTINPSTMEKLGYDPLLDFRVVWLLLTHPLAIAVHPSVPANSLRELITLVRASPSKYSYASTGHGGIAHIAAELLKDYAGIPKLLHVPYKGGAPGVQDAIAGHVPILFDTLGPVVPHHSAGRLRILATTGSERSRLAPEIPTAAQELNLPDYVAVTANWVVVPANTPSSIVERLAAAVQSAISDPEFVKDLERQGNDVVVNGDPVKGASFMRNEIARWAAVVKKAGIRAAE